MTVRLYRATDVDAPVLNGEIGTLAILLEKCLVSGYGSKAPAGWAIEFNSGVNKIALRPPQGNRPFLRIDDEVVGNHRLASVIGFTSMTDIDTGTGAFPLASQSTYGIQILKSDVEDGSPARDWILLATEKLFYLITNWNNQSSFANAEFFAFGDYVSYNGSDQYNSLIAGRKARSYSIASDLNPLGTYTTIGNTIDGLFSARSYTQLGSSVKLGKHGDSSKDGCQFPNPVDGGIYYSPIWLTEPNVVRGILPGVWYIPHSAANLNHTDTFEGAGAHVGKTFFLCKYYQGIVALEISDTW